MTRLRDTPAKKGNGVAVFDDARDAKEFVVGCLSVESVAGLVVERAPKVLSEKLDGLITIAIFSEDKWVAKRRSRQGRHFATAVNVFGVMRIGTLGFAVVD